MAAKDSAKKKKDHEAAEGVHEAVGDFAAVAEHMKQNPIIYGVGAVFVALCVVAGVIFNLNSRVKERELTTKYIRALENEDASMKVTALEAIVSSGKGTINEGIIYLAAESAYKAKEYSKASDLFTQLRDDFPESKFVPDAVEGLGYIAENAENYDGAIDFYNEVINTWPESLAGYRQNINIARCYEKADRLKDAIKAYQRELAVFPGSSVYNEAQAALDRLREKHSELFTEPEVTAILQDPQAPAEEGSDTTEPEETETPEQQDK